MIRGKYSWFLHQFTSSTIGITVGSSHTSLAAAAGANRSGRLRRTTDCASRRGHPREWRRGSRRRLKVVPLGGGSSRSYWRSHHDIPSTGPRSACMFGGTCRIPTQLPSKCVNSSLQGSKRLSHLRAGRHSTVKKASWREKATMLEEQRTNKES